MWRICLHNKEFEQNESGCCSRCGPGCCLPPSPWPLWLLRRYRKQVQGGQKDRRAQQPAQTAAARAALIHLLKVTKAKPRACPVSLSVGILTCAHTWSRDPQKQAGAKPG
jgi:hypothetical protein